METHMRTRLTCLALTLITAAAVVQLPAQQPAKQAKAPQPDKIYTSANDVVAMMAKAKNERKQDQATFSQNILRLAPYGANLEYRAAVGPAATHPTEAEMFYVIDGSGTLITGGTIVNDAKSNAPVIQGGTPQAVAKGDFIIVPENTPHWFSTINGTLVLMSLHLPRPLPAAR